jgi:hypothetical protein
MGNLEPGCLAIIIESVDGHSTGKIVQCIKVVGTHSKFGIIWHVRSKDILITEFGAKGNEADVPAKWLKKIEPGDGTLNSDSKVIKKKDLITDKT